MLDSTYEDRSVKLLIITWVFCGLGITSVILRFYSRVTITREFWLDDFWIALSLTCDVGMCIMRTIFAANNYARHAYVLTPQEIESAARLSWLSLGMAIAAHCCGRLSVAFLLYRIQGHHKWTSRILKFFIIMISMTSIAAILLTYLQCSPSRALWELALRAPGLSSCINIMAYVYSIIGIASFWCFSDFALATIPVSMVWNLKASIRKKILLSFLLGLGIFAGLCAAVKVYYCTVLLHSDDFTWVNCALYFWDTIETNVIIIAACAVTLGPLALKISGRDQMPPALHISGKPRPSVIAVFEGTRRKKSAKSGCDMETSHLRPMPIASSFYSLGSNGRPPVNGASNAYSSGDLPFLTDAGIEVQQQLGIDTDQKGTTRRFEEEGYR